MDKHAAVDAARLRQLLVPHSQTIWEDSLTQSKGVARNINPTHSPNSHNPFSQIPRIVLVVEGHHKLDLSLHISLLFNVVQELHVVAGLLEEENRSRGIHLARLIKRLHSHVTMKGPPSPRWFERKEHIDQFMDMLSEFAGHQRHRHSETLQLDIGLLLMDRKGGDQNTAHSKQGRDVIRASTRWSTQRSYARPCRHPRRCPLHQSPPRSRRTSSSKETAERRHQRTCCSSAEESPFRSASNCTSRRNKGPTPNLQNSTLSRAFHRMFQRSSSGDGRSVCLRIPAPIESIRIDVIDPTNISNDIALLQDIRIAGSDHH